MTPIHSADYYQTKYPQLEDVESIVQAFSEMYVRPPYMSYLSLFFWFRDVKREGSIDSGDLMRLVKRAVGKEASADELLRVCREVSSGKDVITIDDYLDVAIIMMGLHQSLTLGGEQAEECWCREEAPQQDTFGAVNDLIAAYRVADTGASRLFRARQWKQEANHSHCWCH